MKFFYSLLLSILFSTLPILSQTQDLPWLETGSEWTYQHGVWTGPEHFQVTYGITEQTIFAGEECAKMEKISSLALGCISLQPPYYFYVSNDSLFYANESDSTFRLVADFGASVGDSWEYQVITDMDDPVVVDTFLITVTGINMLNIEGEELRELELDYEWLGSSSGDELWLGLYGGNLTEVIGGNGFFAPFGHLGACDYETDVTFQCFDSPSFSYLNPIYPSCNYVVGIEESGRFTELSVFPNPSNGIVNIEIPPSWASEEATLQLYTSTGKLVYEQIGYLKEFNTIGVGELGIGIYFLEVLSGNKSGKARIAID